MNVSSFDLLVYRVYLLERHPRLISAVAGGWCVNSGGPVRVLPLVSGDRGCGARDAHAAGRSAVRVLGAAVFATVCVYAALGTHLLAGGSGAPLGVVAAATAATGAGAFLLGRRRRGRGVLVAASFAAQYGMHQLFSADLLGPGVQVTGHHHGGPLSGVAMPLMHVLVAAMCAWWLERGETALVTVLVLLGCSLAGLWRAAPPVLVAAAPLRPAPAAGQEPPVRAPQMLAWVLSHRGPPRRSEEDTASRRAAARPAR